MLKDGDIVDAVVEKLETYGIYLKCGTDRILVLAPDLTDKQVDVRAFAKLGDVIRVKILLLNSKTAIYRGSVKDAG